MENLVEFVNNIEWTEIEEMHHKMKQNLEEVNRRLSDSDIDLPFRNIEDVIESHFDDDAYDDEEEEYEYQLNRVDFPGLLPGESPIQYERRMANEREDNNE
jgi:phage-related protein